MTKKIVKIIINRNATTGEPESINYEFSGFIPNLWLAIFLNSSKIIRFQLNSNGELSGFFNSLNESIKEILSNVGSITIENNYIPLSGTICGMSNTISDSENPDRDGIWSLEVKYD